MDGEEERALVCFMAHRSTVRNLRRVGGGKIVKAVQVYKWQVRNVTAHFPKNAAVSPSVCSAVLEHIRPA